MMRVPQKFIMKPVPALAISVAAALFNARKKWQVTLLE